MCVYATECNCRKMESEKRVSVYDEILWTMQLIVKRRCKYFWYAFWKDHRMNASGSSVFSIMEWGKFWRYVRGTDLVGSCLSVSLQW